MALVILDRVKETTTTAGAGTITLLGAATGFQAFSAVGNANTTYYCIASQTLNEWEVGVGTYTLSGTTLARTQILASSNSGSVVTFSAGTKDVFVTYPAGYSVSQADTGTAPNQIPLNQYLGTMAFQDANSVNIQGGLVQNATISPANVTAYQLVANSYPSTPPSLMLDFANSKTLDPRITFTRASTATYYDGVTTALAEQNLFTYSQAIGGTGWSLNANATAVLNSAVAPDGTATATTFTAVQQFSNVQSVLTLPAGTNTLSIYAYRSSGTNLISVYSNGGQNLGSYNPTSTWQRFTITFTLAVSEPVVICQDRNTSGYTPIYLWGAQLEQRSSATTYTPTTTQPIANYIPVMQTAVSGQARFDSNPTTGESLGLLIEESRVNLTTYSSAFDNAAWTKTASSITTAANIAPDGTQTAQKLVEDTTTAIHYVSDVITSLTAQAYTCTVYAKKAERDFVYLSLAGGPFGSYPAAKFDLTNGITTIVTNVQSVTSSILAVGNGWYRCSMTATGSTTGTTNLQIWIGQSATYNYLGNGYSGIFIWGAQLEAGAFATSYIPTVASQVTRAADLAIMTGTNFSSWSNVGSGSLYSEATSLATATAVIASLNGTTAGFEEVNTRFPNSGGGVGGIVRINNVNTVFNDSTGATGVFYKQAMSYQNNSQAYSRTGSLQTSSSTGSPNTLNSFTIGGRLVTGGSYLNGTIKRITYYPVALTSTQLVALTT